LKVRAPWFDDRAAPCRSVFVDYATAGMMQLRFVALGIAFDYLRTTRAFWRRVAAVRFEATSTASFGEQPDLPGARLTQFGPSRFGADIDIIFAKPPAGEGRIERAFGTLQDRMVRVGGFGGKTSSIAAANHGAWVHHPRLHTRFGRDPANARNLHRRWHQPCLDESSCGRSDGDAHLDPSLRTG